MAGKVRLLYFTLLVPIYFTAYSNAEVINFIPVDSIQISSTCVEARDITGDNIDEIFVGTNGGFYIYDGITFDLIEADSSLPGPVGDIEIGDIEGDGLFDYFVAVHGDNRALYIYRNEQIIDRRVWPGYLTGNAVSLHFYTEDDSTFLNFTTGIGYRLNLINWAIEYYVFPHGFGAYYADSMNMFNMYTVYNQHYDFVTRYIRKFSKDFDIENEISLYTYGIPYTASFRSVMGDLIGNNEFELYYHLRIYEYGEPVYLNLIIRDSDLNIILQRSYTNLLNPGAFKAYNFYSDNHVELVTDLNDGNEHLLYVFDSNANIIATAPEWPDMNYTSACELDGDSYDEIAFRGDSYIVFYNTEITTDIADDYSTIPVSSSLRIYPNPFNGELNISFECEKAGKLDLRVFDVLGREVDFLFGGKVNIGEHIYKWSPNSQKTTSGTYFVVTKHNDSYNTAKTVYLK